MSESSSLKNKNHTEWKKPQRYLGPSQLASCLGLNQFMSATDLKDRLENGYPRFENRAIQMGINSEDRIRSLYSSYTKFKVVKAPWKNLFYNSRIGGQADGLIYDSSGVLIRGVEIKCHLNRPSPLMNVPDYYLPQIVAYMQIYMVDTWDFMSACVNDKGEIYDYKITTVYWDSVKKLWAEKWYPEIDRFIQSVNWKFNVF